MSSYCKYCHESDHAASDCPKFSSGKRACFLCLKRGHVGADCPERTPAAKWRCNGRSVTRLPSSTQFIPSDSENIITETPSGEHDDLTSIPKSKETILVQDQHPEILEEAAPPVHSPSYLQSKYASLFKRLTRILLVLSLNHPLLLRLLQRLILMKWKRFLILLNIRKNIINHSLVTQKWMKSKMILNCQLPSLLPKAFLFVVAIVNVTLRTNLIFNLLLWYCKAFKLLSLNGNGFFKVSKPSTRRQFIRHIRSYNPIFAALQEMDNSDSPFFQFDLLHQQFVCHQTLWT